MGSARNSLPQAWIRLTWRARLNFVLNASDRPAPIFAAPNPVRFVTLRKILQQINLKARKSAIVKTMAYALTKILE